MNAPQETLMTRKYFLITGLFLAFSFNAFSIPITSVSINDYNQIKTQLDNHLNKTNSGIDCKFIDINHDLELRVKDSIFMIRSKTQFRCKGQKNINEGEFCIIEKNKDNKWILQYCD